MYEDLVEKLVEVDEAVSKSQALLKRHFAGRSKKLGTGLGVSSGWIQYWLLVDGTVVPVKHSHEKTARNAGTNMAVLLGEGAYRIYINVKSKELNAEGYRKLSLPQKSAVIQAYIEYKIQVVRAEFDFEGTDYLEVQPKSVEELDYYLTYGKDDVDEAVATATTAAEVLKDFYRKDLNRPLKKSDRPGEDWYKFWLMQDGTLIPVTDSHMDTIMAAQVGLPGMEAEGILPGYITDDGELGIRGRVDVDFSTEQILILLELQKIHHITSVQPRIGSSVHVDSAKDLSNFLRYGAAKKVYEVTATMTKTSFNKKIKDYYKKIVNGELVKSDWGGPETDWRKFWLLSDGSIIPVAQKDSTQTHIDVANDAGVQYNDMLYFGAVRAYVKDNEEMGLDFEKKKLTSQQRSVLRQLYISYKTPIIYYHSVETDFRETNEVDSIGELDYLLQYGESSKHNSMYEAIEVPKYLYHGTFKPLLDKIKSEGLRIEGTVKNYSDSEEGLIYLAKNFEEAEAFAEVSETVPDEWIDQIVVLKIDTDKLDKSKLADDPNVRDTEVMTFIYSKDIPPEALEVMTPSSGLDESGYAGTIEAGWIHSNGEREEFKNYVSGDHDRDAFKKMYPNKVWSTSFGGDLTEPYYKYLRQGHIRYIQTARGFNIELVKKPTESQMRAIRKGIKENESGEFYFSIQGLEQKEAGGDSWKEFIEVVRKMKKESVEEAILTKVSPQGILSEVLQVMMSSSGLVESGFASEETMQDLGDIKNNEEQYVLNSFLNRKEGSTQYPNYWPVMSAARVIKIWNDYAKDGFVRDEKGINKLANILHRAIMRLVVNTELSGHTSYDPTEFIEEQGIDEEELMDWLTDEKGGDILSDYAWKELTPLNMALYEEENSEEKLQFIDRILNVIHQRGDLAKLFIEGGTKTLNQLAGVV